MTTNPFPAFIDELNSKLYLDAKGAYLFQTYLLSSVLTVLLILQLISLFVRWKKGVFWIFRLHSTKFGRILIPNGIITWSITSAIFLVLLQGFYAAMRKYCKPGEDLNNDMLWRSCIWIPLYLGTWCMTYGTFLAPILSNPTGQSNSSSLARYPILLNSIFLIVPVIVCATIIPLSILLNNSYNEAFSIYKTLLGLLEASSAAFDTLQPPSDVLELYSNRQALEEILPTVLDQWKAVFTAWYIFVGLLTIAFIAASIFHFRSLGSAITNLRLRNSAEGAYSNEMMSLASAFRSLIFTTVLVTFVAVLYLILDIVLAATASQIVRGGTVVELLILGVGYVYSVFGGLAIIVTVVRAFTSPLASTSPLSQSSTQRQIPLEGTTIKRTTIPVGKFENKLNYAQTVEVNLDDRDLEAIGYGRRKEAYELDFASIFAEKGSDRDSGEVSYSAGKDERPFVI